MSQYEDRPKDFAMFPMSDEDIRKKEDFYDEKGWDLDKVPEYSGKLITEDGALIRFEARMVEGTNGRGDFFVGRCYTPTNQPDSNGGGDRRSSRRDRDDRGRGRDDRGGRGRDRGGRGRDRDARRERDDDRRSRDDRGGYDDDLDDDVPF